MKQFALGIVLWCLSSLIPVSAAVLNKAQLKEGENIYKAHCAVCHMSGVAGAPKVHNQQDWEVRIQKATTAVKNQDPSLKGEPLEKKAMEYLINSVKTGIGAMPPHGMCPTCTDKQYYDAISFMKSAEPGKNHK